MKKTEHCDVLVIGSGIAGLTCAIKLAEKKIKTIIVTRASRPEECNSSWAQGGIIFPQMSDIESLITDIQKASSESSDEEVARIIASSHDLVEEILLKKAQTHFKKNEDGTLKLTKEAAHSTSRIIYDGDHTGKSIQISLLNYIENLQSPYLQIISSATALDLITPSHHGKDIHHRYCEHQVLGAYIFHQKEDLVQTILANKTVLATGGIGNLYLHNSNTYSSRGDGHAMAKRVGARIINMEFIQFHPTTLFIKKGHSRFLISETLRGEGGKLLDQAGKPFMQNYHPDRELAPRDVVSQAIWEEMIAKKQDYVYLDMTHLSTQHLQTRFPTIFEKCMESQIDISQKPIPVVPAAHYTCGGVHTDIWGKTNVAHLYAIGEVACNGLHGANRLASTSLLEGLVFGYRAAEKIAEENSPHRFSASDIMEWQYGAKELDLTLVGQDWLTLKQTMWNYVGIKRTTDRLNRAEAMFREMNQEIERFYKDSVLHDELIGLRNAVEIAQMVVSASKRNQKSLGCFFKAET